MDLFEKILNRLNGLHFRQEYLCHPSQALDLPLCAYLVSGDRVICDITSRHHFVGYHPLIFALDDRDTRSEWLDILFCHGPLPVNAVFRQKDAIAFLKLRRIPAPVPSFTGIGLYEGVAGGHRFLSPFHQRIVALHNRLYHQKPGNVFLENPLYRQVQVAYSVSRHISLVTVAMGGLYNLFPTDLHGPVGDRQYIISLRKGGKACEQVLTARTILLSRVEPSFYQTVYALGRNHMQEMKTAEYFPLALDEGPPIPQHTVSWLELEWQEILSHGIHNLLLFKIINRGGPAGATDSLCHVHNVYATWRHNNGLGGNYLLR